MNHSKLLLLHCRDSWDLNPWLLGFGANRLVNIVTSLTGQKSFKQPWDIMCVDFICIENKGAGGLDELLALW